MNSVQLFACWFQTPRNAPKWGCVGKDLLNELFICYCAYIVKCKIEMQNRSNFLSGALPRASLGGQSSRLYVTATTGVRAPDLSCELEPARALSAASRESANQSFEAAVLGRGSQFCGGGHSSMLICSPRCGWRCSCHMQAQPPPDSPERGQSSAASLQVGCADRR